MNNGRHANSSIKPIRRFTGQCYVQPKRKPVVRKLVREALVRLGWRNLTEREDSNGGYMFYYEVVGVEDREAAHRKLTESLRAIGPEVMGGVFKWEADGEHVYGSSDSTLAGKR